MSRKIYLNQEWNIVQGTGARLLTVVAAVFHEFFLSNTTSGVDAFTGLLLL